MKKSINIKIVISLLLVILLFNIFCSSSQAISDMMAEGKSFLEAGNSVEATIDTTALKSTSDYIYNVLLAIASIVAIIVAMVLGIQFMAASADEKAKVKEAIIPFIVGCIVVFGSFTIWKVAIKIGNSTEEKTYKQETVDSSSGTPNKDGTTDYTLYDTQSDTWYSYTAE